MATIFREPKLRPAMVMVLASTMEIAAISPNRSGATVECDEGEKPRKKPLNRAGNDVVSLAMERVVVGHDGRRGDPTDGIVAAEPGRGHQEGEDEIDRITGLPIDE